MIHQVEGVREHGWRLLGSRFKREERKREIGREVREMVAHLTPAGWRAIEEVVGVGGHGAEVETADLQELLLFGVRRLRCQLLFG